MHTRSALRPACVLLALAGLVGGVQAQGQRPGRAEAPRPLSDVELAIAMQVHVGTVPCELGQRVAITADPAAPGHFRLELGKARYRVAPQPTTTGAIRLEDKSAGIVWLQLSNKSMLLDQKQGRRLADECRSAAQERVAQAMAVRPPPSILDPVPAAGTPVAVQD